MKGLLADNDVGGQLEVLRRIVVSSFWREVWASLTLSFFRFEDLGLAPDAPDSVVWETCQRLEIVLITGTRNEDKPDSLEATLRLRNTATSLPVITLADAKRISAEPSYANRAAEKLLEYLLSIDEVRGAGRLYMP